MLSRSNSTATPLSRRTYSHRPHSSRSVGLVQGGEESTSDPIHQFHAQAIAHASLQPHASQATASHHNSSKRQQAEAAALEAYQRARAIDEHVEHDYRPAPPKLQRRRSRASGRTEGGHFEDARLGRRKSGNTKPRKEGGGLMKHRSSPQRSSGLSGAIASELSEGETIVTRKRFIIPPGSDYTVQDSSASVVPSAKWQSRSEYTNGSPVPRQSTGPPSSLRRPPRERNSNIQGYREATSAFANFDSAFGTRVGNITRESKPSPTIARDLIDQARDKAFQDFQPKKVRERKSTFFASLNKLRPNETQKRNYIAFDDSLPPINHATERAVLPDVPPPPPPSQVPTYSVPLREKKSRNFTESLKGRFKKAFGKTAKEPSGLPAQHVEGRTFHFSTRLTSSPEVMAKNEGDPFTAFDHDHERILDSNFESTEGKHTARAPTADTTVKSRMTSWTNSTAAGTWSTRSEVKDDGSVGEQGQLKRSDSVSTLRKARSFFGRPIQNKLRKPSKAQLSGSEESSGLYSALQERIYPSESASQVPVNDNTLTSRTSSALATLPSQQRQSLAIGSSKSRGAPTVRAVTPDPGAYILNVPSPVAEVLSPEVLQTQSGASAKKSHASDTPKSQLQRRPAIKAPTPSKEQVARRMQRSEHRWQGALDEMSPPALSSHGLADRDHNPYELRSLSRTLQQPPVLTDALPHHARVSAEVGEKDDRATALMSPSVYSRNTDEASPRPDTPAEAVGTMVTITGREVRSYSISPWKKPEQTEKPVPASGEWRRWLSDEWKDLSTNAPMKNFSLPRNLINDQGQTPSLQMPTGDIIHVNGSSSHGRPESSSPPLIAPAIDTLPKRPRPQSSRSSFMNDRYPMMDTRRNTSDGRKATSRGSSRPGSIEPRMQVSCVLDSKDDKTYSVDSPLPSSTPHSPKMVSEYPSMVGIGVKTQVHGDGNLTYFEPDVTPDSLEPKLPTEPPRNTTSNSTVNKTSISARPKSAFDLRANYKIRSTGKTHSIAINRTNTGNPFSSRPVTHPASSPLHILDDTTIRNISAGPYASSPSPSALPSCLASAGADKENSSPIPSSPLPPSSGGLPALSSSEWLAAGGWKSKERGKMRTAAKDGGSPGQRMVTGWLEGRGKSKEGTPAYI